MKAQALSEALTWAADRLSQFEGMYWGYKVRGGVRSIEPSVVFVVARKRPSAMLRSTDIVPQRFGGEPTDVVEQRYASRVLPPGDGGDVSSLAFTQKRRPCPAGFSVGHTRITAGTIGAPVRRVRDGKLMVVTNNHVGADSNGGSPGDWLIQPGRADGGRIDPADYFARLSEFVQINFEGQNGDGKKTRGVFAMIARGYWRTIQVVGNSGARMTGCPLRVQVRPNALQQPTPNLVDAAIAEPWANQFTPEMHQLGKLTGRVDFELGDQVQKVGRTTEYTVGTVVGVDAVIRVSYGSGKIAAFANQLVIESDAGDFSQPGDSGSGVLSMDMRLGGLLFAGGDRQTIVNRFSDVERLLGVEAWS